jgi:hypothetical protein
MRADAPRSLTQQMGCIAVVIALMASSAGFLWLIYELGASFSNP